MKLSKYAKFRDERFGGVLFETRAEKVFALNPTAAAVIREISAGPVDEGTLVERVVQVFDGAPTAIGRDVLALLADLREKGLVED